MNEKTAWFLSVTAIISCILVVGAHVLNQGTVSLGAAFLWTQTDWSGGFDDGAEAVHPDDQDGWNKYSAMVNLTSNDAPGEIRIASEEFYFTDDEDPASDGLAAGGGFGNGTAEQVMLAEIGEDTDVVLSATFTPVNSFNTDTEPVPGTVGTGAAYHRADGENVVYVARGDGSTDFFRYSVTDGTWTPLASSPGIITNRALVRDGTSDLIYALGGSGTAALYVYSISSNNWTTLASAPGNFGTTSNNMVLGEGGYIYALAAGNTTSFYRYSISENSWTTLANAPAFITASMFMLHNTNEDFIYVLKGGTTSFYRYSISENSWATLASLSVSASTGSFMLRNGDDDSVYVIHGGSSSFSRYSISGDSWTPLASTAYVREGSTLRLNGDNIYLAAGGFSEHFRRYSITNNTWTTLSSVPTRVSTGGYMLHHPSEDKIYVVPGGSTNAVHVYSVSQGEWLSMQSTVKTQGGIGVGARLLYDPSSELMYLVRGDSTTSFYKYDIANKSWASLASLPSNITAGDSIIRNSDDDYIYLLRESNTTGFYRYSITNDSWTTLAPIPAAAWNGSFLIRNGSDDYIYALRGNKSSGFYRYSIAANEWESLADVPGTVDSGGAMLRYASDNEIYVVRGKATGDFYKYTISTNEWITLAPAPGLISLGGRAIRNGASNDIYVVRGDRQRGFYRYSITDNTWVSLPDVPGEVSSGSSMMFGRSADEILLLQGYQRSAIYQYTISTNSWSTFAGVPGRVDAGGNMVLSDDGNVLYVVQGNKSDNFWEYTINQVDYAPSGTFTSAVIDTSGVLGFGDLAWTQTVPAGTSLTVATRTGSTPEPDNAWSEWSDEMSDPSGAPMASPVARYVQYRALFASSNSERTPRLHDLTIAYTAYQPSGTLESSIFNSFNAGNLVGGISWQEDETLPAGTGVTLSLRAAPSVAELVGPWADFTNATANCQKSNDTVTCLPESIPAQMKSGKDAQVFQYKITLQTDDRGHTPTISSVSIGYGLEESRTRGGTIMATKEIINDNEGTKSQDSFSLFINGSAIEADTAYRYPAGMYVITATKDPSYAQYFSEGCTEEGIIYLDQEEVKTCRVVIDDLGSSQISEQPSGVPSPPEPSETQDGSHQLSYDVGQALASAPTISLDKDLMVAGTGGCEPETLLKAEDDKTVYYCGVDRKKYYFPDEGTYYSWYEDFAGIQVVSQERLSRIDSGGMVTYRPGKKMLKTMASADVYVVGKGGVLHLVPDETLASALYGRYWTTFVSDLNPVFFKEYKIGEPVIIVP